MPLLDETAAEVLASVLTAAGRGLRLALAAPRGRERADIDVARWLDTYALSDVALSTLPGGLPEDGLEAFLLGNDIQAILQELLAARLTDAPEAEAERLLGLFTASGRGLLSDVGLAALFEFFDEQVCALVVRVSSADPGLLHQIRQDAYLARIVAAIDRHVAVCEGRLDSTDDRDFVVRYRRHAADFHGRLQPPDFERRRLVPIDDLYVSPTVSHVIEVEPGKSLPQTDIWRLDDELDHAVLLGDPGGGKTTASHALMHHHAVDARSRVPFMVILREFAAVDPPERSVLAHIEHKLETFYQCQPADRLVERLLLSGSAFVIFDGLDELLDTSRRSEVAAIIEQFCAEYPLTRVLVTSRTIGYDQARLDDRQFECFQISGFDEGHVAEYVHKWFACQDGIEPGEAGSFLEESAGAGDLRSNPLMLALMCILYRGEGSIPRSRPEVYEKCATLLFHKWDASRKIHLEMRARNLIEPALRHLAYWLFTRAEAHPAVTELELVSQTAAYFMIRGFERADAEAAAREFVEFCRGRLWVFTEAGTTARGEGLYTFTHRTFLEYFAAAYLASIHDSPEQLARKLAGRLARSEWDTVAQLAVQIKDHACERGADRVFQTLLAERRYRSARSIGNILGFLGRCTAFAEPTPSTVQELAARAFKHALADTSKEQLVAPLAWLMVSVHDDLKNKVATELEARVRTLVESSNSEERLAGLRLALQLHNAPFAIRRGDEAWQDWEISSQYQQQLMESADSARDIAAYLCFGPEKASVILARRKDLPGFLFEMADTGFVRISWVSPARNALSNIPNQDSLNGPIFDYVNVLLRESSPPPPIPIENADQIFGTNEDGTPWTTIGNGELSSDIYLSAAYMIFVFAEAAGAKSQLTAEYLGSLGLLHAYLMRRWEISSGECLQPLPLDERWQEIFIRWANKEIDFARKPGANNS